MCDDTKNGIRMSMYVSHDNGRIEWMRMYVQLGVWPGGMSGGR